MARSAGGKSGQTAGDEGLAALLARVRGGGLLVALLGGVLEEDAVDAEPDPLGALGVARAALVLLQQGAGGAIEQVLRPLAVVAEEEGGAVERRGVLRDELAVALWHCHAQTPNRSCGHGGPAVEVNPLSLSIEHENSYHA